MQTLDIYIPSDNILNRNGITFFKHTGDNKMFATITRGQSFQKRFVAVCIKGFVIFQADSYTGLYKKVTGLGYQITF